MSTNIQVAVRVRPFLPFEAGSKSCIDVLPGDGSASAPVESSQGREVRIRSSAHSHKFTFGELSMPCLWLTNSQALLDIHKHCFRPVLQRVVDAGRNLPCADRAVAEKLPGGLQRHHACVRADGGW